MLALSPPISRRPRDVRLDVFRGLCLVIIFVAHVWSNPWAQLIPARFGFSDATEIFVFCSGMASAAAFGSVFRSHGFVMGAARVAFRCWQVFWCHIGLLLLSAAAMIAIDSILGTGGSYLKGLGLDALADGRGAEALLGALTLRWVPFYFDILPMYLVILAMIPVVVRLQWIGTHYAAAAVLGTWLLSNAGMLELPAEPWSGRAWFFNPFGWQLIFFSGFALMSGWVKAPEADARLVKVTAAVALLSLPLAWAPAYQSADALAAARNAIAPLIDKTHFGLLRYVHFLSLAYLACVAAGEGGHRLSGPIAEALRCLGQQSLAVFMSGLLLSFLSSTVLNLTGRDFASVAIVNITGIALLLAVARITAFFKSEPWARRDKTGAASHETGAAGRPGPVKLLCRQAGASAGSLDGDRLPAGHAAALPVCSSSRPSLS